MTVMSRKQMNKIIWLPSLFGKTSTAHEENIIPTESEKYILENKLELFPREPASNRVKSDRLFRKNKTKS